jgi:hypothetical protein
MIAAGIQMCAAGIRMIGTYVRHGVADDRMFTSGIWMISDGNRTCVASRKIRDKPFRRDTFRGSDIFH